MYEPHYSLINRLNSVIVSLLQGWIWHYLMKFYMPLNKETKPNPQKLNSIFWLIHNKFYIWIVCRVFWGKWRGMKDNIFINFVLISRNFVFQIKEYG